MTNESNKISVFNTGILSNMDATEIAEKIKQKDISPGEAVACVKERVELANPIINAVVSSDYEMNLKNVPTEGAFSGVPMFIKDLCNVKGFPTRHGCAGIPDNPVKKTDPYIKQIESTGCVVVGKSATSEFGLLPSSETNVNGDTCNPVNTAYSTGGSSGGAAALVASGVVPMAHAMDGGGSIRIPASCCGLIGLKPSRGRHVASPTALLPIDIVTQGMVSRTVRDTASYFAAIEQYHQHKKLPPIGSIKEPSSRRLKIAMFTQNPAGIECHADVSKTVQAAGKKCAELGHDVEYISNPYDDNILFDFLIYYSLLARLIKTFGKFSYNTKFKSAKTESFTLGLASHFNKFILLAPGSFKRLRNDVITEYNAMFEKYDVLLSPTLLGPVPKLGFYGPEVGFISLVMRLNNYVNFTVLQNVTGAPAISLPMGFCTNGLPIGAQFAAKIGDEKTLLELAFELEAAGSFPDLHQVITNG